jgi:hypothetical protein
MTDESLACCQFQRQISGAKRSLDSKGPMFSIQVYEMALGASVPCGRRNKLLCSSNLDGLACHLHAFQPRPKSGPPLLAYTCSRRSLQRQESDQPRPPMKVIHMRVDVRKTHRCHRGPRQRDEFPPAIFRLSTS